MTCVCFSLSVLENRLILMLMLENILCITCLFLFVVKYFNAFKKLVDIFYMLFFACSCCFWSCGSYVYF